MAAQNQRTTSATDSFLVACAHHGLEVIRSNRTLVGIGFRCAASPVMATPGTGQGRIKQSILELSDGDSANPNQ